MLSRSLGKGKPLRTFFFLNQKPKQLCQQLPPAKARDSWLFSTAMEEAACTKSRAAAGKTGFIDLIRRTQSFLWV